MSEQAENTTLQDLLESGSVEAIMKAFALVAEEPSHPVVQKNSLLLGRASLKELPSEIGLFSQLKRLVLAYNQLQTLPESIGELSLLEDLSLASNPLTELPPEFAQLRLQLLNLDATKFRTFPLEICGITSLEILSMRRCFFIRSLPDEIGALTQLKSFSLASGQLRTLPESFGALSELTSLDLADNNVRSLPVSIVQLDKLEKLDLSKNQLKILPEGLAGWKSLKELDLRHNKFLPIDQEDIKEQLPECQIRF